MKKIFSIIIVCFVILGITDIVEAANSCEIHGISTCTQFRDAQGNKCIVKNNKCVSADYLGNGSGGGAVTGEYSCRLITMRSGDKKISFTFYDGDYQRTGYIYKMNLVGGGNGPAFCLDPGKSNRTTYHKVRELSANSAIDRAYASIYQWYLDNGDLEMTQLGIWYVAEKERTNSQISTDEFTNMLITYYKRDNSKCNDYETELREIFKNEKFSCDCYFDHSISGCSEIKYSKNDCSNLTLDKSNCYKEVNTKDYQAAFNQAQNDYVKKNGVLRIGSHRDEVYLHNTAVNMLTGPVYKAPGSSTFWLGLYIYEPDGGTDGYQRILSIGECDDKGYLCDKEWPNYIAGKYGSDLTSATTIAKFKAVLVDPERVKIGEDGKAYCSSNPNYCNNLLETGTYTKYATCDKLKSSIDDPYNVEDCNDNAGYVTYLKCKGTVEIKCDPEVNPDYARCDNKGSGDDHVIKLSDAVLSNQEPSKEACILNNEAYNVQGDKISSKFADIGYNGNVYCSIYCWEDLELELPSEPQPYGYYSPISAGRMFQWGVENNSNIFAKMEVHKTCWIKQRSADYGLFEKNWNDNDDAIKQRYADYLAQVDYNKQTDSDIKTGDRCCLAGESESAGETKCGMTATQCQAFIGAINGCWQEPEGSGNWCGTKSAGSSCTGKKYSLPSVDYTLPGTNVKGTSSSKEVCAASTPNVSELYDSAEESSRRDAVQSALNERVSIYNAIMRCQSTSSLNTSTMYDNQTKLTIQDNNDLKLNTRGVSNFTLEKVATYINVETPAVDLGYRSGTALRCYQVPTANGFSYSTGDPCASGDNSYTITTYSRQHANGQNNEYVWKYTGNWNFIYPADFYFVAKMSNDYVNSITKELPNVERSKYTDEIARIKQLDKVVENEKKIYLVEHGKPGIPTYIDTETKKFNIDITIENLGSMKDGVSHFAKVVENKDLYEWIDLDTYTCPYQVENIIFRDEDGPCTDKYCFALVYRVIDMGAGNTARIFPGKDGNDGTKSRKIGTNWASFISSNSKKFTRITTSTNESKTGIYDKKPIYSIELSPTLIGEIRKDNNKYRDAGKDPYTSYEYPNQTDKIKCNLTDSVEDTTCVSGYITELIKKGKITGRLAINDETLRIKKISEYKAA